MDSINPKMRRTSVRRCGVVSRFTLDFLFWLAFGFVLFVVCQMRKPPPKRITMSSGTYQIRLQALELATAAVTQYNFEEGEGFMPTLWSLAVFYESFLLEGAAGTREPFGPKPPVKLERVK